MIRIALLAGATALCVAPMAQADHTRYGNSYGNYHQSAPVSVNRGCERQKNDNRLAGSLIGAVAGGALGVAIADDDDHYRGRRGYRGYRGYRGHRGYRHHNNGGDELAGALIGGVLGAVVGGEIAASSTDCKTTRVYEYSGDPYAPTRSPVGPQWEPQHQPSTTRVYSTTPQPTRTVTTRTVSGHTHGNDDLYGGPVRTTTYPSQPTTTTTYPSQPTQVYNAECRTVQRETRLPDSSLVREPVQVCRDQDGRWNMTNGAGY